MPAVEVNALSPASASVCAPGHQDLAIPIAMFAPYNLLAGDCRRDDSIFVLSYWAARLMMAAAVVLTPNAGVRFALEVERARFDPDLMPDPIATDQSPDHQSPG